MVGEHVGIETNQETQGYLLLVAFGGQLEPKINREFMVNGFPVVRVEAGSDQEPDLGDIDLAGCRGVVFSGGNDSVYDESARSLPETIMELPVPKLGICYGQQRMVHEFGGTVELGEVGEYGKTTVALEESPLFKGIGQSAISALMSHRDVVTELPEGFSAIAHSPAGIAGVTNNWDIYAVQFHPESSETEYGTQVLLNFATEVCGMQPDPAFSEDTYRDRGVEQQSASAQRLLGAVGVHTKVFESGGVDSATAQVLTTNAMRSIGKGNTVSGIYVDNGLMRHEDGDTIKILNSLGYPVETQDWSDFFLHQAVPLPEIEAKRRGYTHLPIMDQTTDPSVMRQIVKYGFMEVQRRVGAMLREHYSDAEIIALVQGTNLADKIESGDHGGDQIKEHHNSGVEEFVDLLFEPLASFFKGDIRKIAVALGLPPEIAHRQPFPGPGLCLRLPANATGETIWPSDIDRRRSKLEAIASGIGNGALNAHWLPVQATGQKGDSRVRDYAVLLSGAYDPELIEQLARDIPAKTLATRVMYTASEVDPDNIVGTHQMVTERYLDPLRDAEEVKRQSVVTNGLEPELSQHYVASLPVSLQGDERPTLMTRMFRTGVRTGLEDYLTGEAALGGLNVDGERFAAVLNDIDLAADDLGYSGAVYDATSKPPGTVELA